MIYYKKKNLFKKIAGFVFRRCNKEKSFSLSFFRNLFSFILILLLITYVAYLFLLPKYLNESNFEKLINNFILKNTKLAMDIADFRVKPNYKFDINLSAKYVRLLYPNKKELVLIEKPMVDIGLLSLVQGFVDFNKVKAQNIAINTNFTTKNLYDCFEYFDINSKNNFKFKVRNINLDVDKFALNIFDKNIGKTFFVKLNNLKISSFEFKKPLIISAFGIVSSDNHKISDFKLKFSVKINEESVLKFKDNIQKLNYNPLFYADLYKFYSKSEIDLKINPQDEKNNVLGFISLKDYHFTLNNYKLPKNSLLLEFKNNKIYTDCDFKFIKDQEIKLNANMSLNKHKFIEAKLNSNEINLFDLKEMLDIAQKIFNFRLNLKAFDFSGLAKINLYLKSNFKVIQSNGKLQIMNAEIFAKKTGLILKNINANINFDNNEINILDASAFINKSKFNLIGKIDAKTNLNLKVNSDVINIAQVLNLVESLSIAKKILPILDEYSFKSGNLKINSEILGNFEKPIIKSESILTSLNVYFKKYKTNVEIPKFEMKLSENNMLLPRTLIRINSIPVFIEGLIKNYKTKHIESELKINSQIDNVDLLINSKKPRLEALLSIKQNKLQIVSCKISDSILISGEILDILNEPILNLKANLNNNTSFKFQNIALYILGESIFSSKVKNANILAKLNLYDIKIANSNLKISDGFLNIKNHNLFFQFPRVSVEDVAFEEIYFEGKIEKENLRISNLNAKILNGVIEASANINLKTKSLNSKIKLKELNIRLLPNKLKEKFLATSGKLSTNTDLELNFGQKNILDSLIANVEFNIINGELSQFAKLERFLQAGNILSQSILKLSLNSALSAITKQNTGDFKEIKGKIKLKNSFADVLYLNSQGSNMSFNLQGCVNLINKKVDLKILGRIPNSIVNIMGSFGSFTFGSQVEKSGGEVSKTTLEKRLSTEISQNDFIKIPPLAYYDNGISTREFVVLINGAIDSLNSIQDFKWVINK